MFNPNVPLLLATALNAWICYGYFSQSRYGMATVFGAYAVACASYVWDNYATGIT